MSGSYIVEEMPDDNDTTDNDTSGTKGGGSLNKHKNSGMLIIR